MSSSALGDQGSGDRLRFMPQPDLPQRRYVIDVHAEAGSHQEAPGEGTAERQRYDQRLAGFCEKYVERLLVIMLQAPEWTGS
jgi:hypothetical protein